MKKRLHMPRENEERKGKRLFDVEKPGKTPPNASSRPLIVGHHTLLQDPMIRDMATNGIQSGKAKAPEPELSQEDKPPVADVASTELTNKMLSPNQVNIEPPQEAEEDSETPNETEETDDKPSSHNHKKSDKSTEDEQKSTIENELGPDDTYKELIETKKYFVSVGVQKRKRSARRLMLAIIFILLLAIALANLLVDTGIVKTDIKPPVSIFKSNQ